jgi:hypothetical protein
MDMELQESPNFTKEVPRYQLIHPNVVWEFSVDELDAEILRLQTELDSRKNLRKMIEDSTLGKVE